MSTSTSNPNDTLQMEEWNYLVHNGQIVLEELIFPVDPKAGYVQWQYKHLQIEGRQTEVELRWEAHNLYSVKVVFVEAFRFSFVGLGMRFTSLLWENSAPQSCSCLADVLKAPVEIQRLLRDIYNYVRIVKDSRDQFMDQKRKEVRAVLAAHFAGEPDPWHENMLQGADS